MTLARISRYMVDSWSEKRSKGHTNYAQIPSIPFF